ncbi:MAG: peptidoglycan-binding domain-containing protein [Sarcina sp.]
MKKSIAVILGLVISSSVGTQVLATTEKEAMTESSVNVVQEESRLEENLQEGEQIVRWKDGYMKYNPQTKIMVIISVENDVDIMFTVSDRSYYVGYSYRTRGEIVKAAQVALNGWMRYAGGKILTVDGQFGPATHNAILNFQRVHTPNGIDGTIGENTWIKLFQSN